jgi:archaetidylserine synthase
MKISSPLTIPDLFSLLNAFFGLAALLLALNGGGRYLAVILIHGGGRYLAVILILLAATADGFDGFLARRLGNSPMGANLDSLADLISFGIAPAALAFFLFGAGLEFFAAACIYVLCGLYRLARFNITPKSDKYFQGLPITASGIVVSVSLLLDVREFTLILMLILSALMVSGVSYPKVRDYRVVSALVLIFLVAASLNWYGSKYSTILIFIALVAYLISPLVISYLLRKR